MSIPIEFTREFVSAHYQSDDHLYRVFLRCGEPYKSPFANSPRLAPPDVRQPLEWGDDHGQREILDAHSAKPGDLYGTLRA